MILYEDMKTVITIQWNRLNTFCFIRYVYFLTWCGHCKHYIIEHIEVAGECITSKNADLTCFFIIKARHPGRPDKVDLGGKISQREPLHGHMWKKACSRNLKWTFEHLMPCHDCVTKTHSRTICKLVSQPSSAVKGADMSELQSHHRMFEHIKWTNHIWTTVHHHLQLSLKCRLPNNISFVVSDQCFCKVATRVRETLLSCAKRGPRGHDFPRASRSFNPALDMPHQQGRHAATVISRATNALT